MTRARRVASSWLFVGVVLMLSLPPVSTQAQTECQNDFSEDFEPEPGPGWTVDTAVNLNDSSPNWAVAEDPAAHSEMNSFVSDASGLDLKDDHLVAPPLDLSSHSRLIFWHRFSFESGFDGGVLEISTDGGTQWVNILSYGGRFEEGGYNGVIDGDSGSPIAHYPAWTGTSPDPEAMTRVEVDVRDPVSGGPYLLRWRLVLDPRAERSTPGGAWWIDDVQVLDLGVDCPPTAVDDFAMTPKNTAVTIQVLSNDSDVDGELLFVTGTTSPSHGTTSIEDNSFVTYTPETAYEGQDAFEYTVCDLPQGGVQCSAAKVFVTVGGELQVLPDPRCSEPGLTVLTDSTGDSLTMEPYHDIERISIAEPPQLGSGRIAFIMKVASLPASPPPNTTWAIVFKDPLDFFVRMRTSQTGPPTFSSGGGTNPAVSGAGTPADPASNFSPDGTIRIVVQRSRIGSPEPGESLFSLLGTVRSHIATINFATDNVPNDQVPAGSYELIGSENCVVNVTPYAVEDSVTARTGFPTRIPVLANDSDADGDALATIGVTNPPNGTASINADNSVTYRSTCGFSGLDTFSYTVSDGQGGTDSALVSVNVRKTSRRSSIC